MDNVPKKILVVDDEPDLHSVLKVRLEDSGFAVRHAYNGEDALTLIRQDPPDLLIIDVVMPGLNGFEVCQRVKREHPNLKVIIYTAKVDAVDSGRAKEAGAELFTVKTGSLVLLLAAIKRILNVEPK